ncbi:hypothetical protein R3D73_004992 [Serratia marcescens]|nr:hypothetical protein [Serratia marcescens]ELQ9442096.1 hypothetical protein [Serratia marcescens]ELT5562886.1 hypothetical protein [Serratia marcescens]
MIYVFPDGSSIFDDEYESWMGDDYITLDESEFDVYENSEKKGDIRIPSIELAVIK